VRSLGQDGSGNSADAVVLRLRARQAEIEEAIFARVCGIACDPAVNGDAEYVAGLRATVAVAVDYVFGGIERGNGWDSVSIPREVGVQAHRAAHNGVGLDVVIRRYMLGRALLWDYVLEEADRIDRNPARPAHPDGDRVRKMMGGQASLLDRLVSDVAREYTAELELARRSREHL
jgi:hypothetical protein